MAESSIEEIASIVAQGLPDDLVSQASAEQIASRTADLLFDERQLVAAVEAGILTSTEAANALIAHIHSWLLDLAGLSWDEDGFNSPQMARTVSGLIDEMLTNRTDE